MSEDMLSVRVYTGQIIQYIIIAPERLKIRDDEGNELGECAICMSNVKDIILSCGHCCMCKQCYETIRDLDRKCPIRREPFRSYIMVYSYAMQKIPINQSMHFKPYNILSLLSNLKLLS
jgi:hypothetical protein